MAVPDKNMLSRCATTVVLVCVNTKNWYRKETDLWAEFGKRAPSGWRFSLKHSVKTSTDGSMSSFGRMVVSRLKEKAFGNT
jgi:hypothetical protein